MSNDNNTSKLDINGPLTGLSIEFPSPAQFDKTNVVKVPASGRTAKVNVEEQKILDQIKPYFDQAVKDSQNNPNPNSVNPNSVNPNQPHDPFNAILEKNIMESRSANIVNQNTKDSQHKHVEFLMNQSKTARIHTVLKNKGMDSQQSAQALKEIIEIIEN